MNLMPYTENYLKRFLLLFKFVPFFIYIMWASETMSQTKPIVAFETTMGGFSVQLEPEKAPETVKNFLKYAREGLYDGTIFHRVINKFMIQGGGFDTDMKERETFDPILNEADIALANKRGTISMARTSDPHSATSQFFINVVYNKFLDHTNKSPQGWGYTAFGRVIDGMNVVGRISRVTTGSIGPYSDVPTTPVIIKKVSITSE